MLCKLYTVCFSVGTHVSDVLISTNSVYIFAMSYIVLANFRGLHWNLSECVNRCTICYLQTTLTSLSIAQVSSQHLTWSSLTFPLTGIHSWSWWPGLDLKQKNCVAFYGEQKGLHFWTCRVSHDFEPPCCDLLLNLSCFSTLGGWTKASDGVWEFMTSVPLAGV